MPEEFGRCSGGQKFKNQLCNYKAAAGGHGLQPPAEKKYVESGNPGPDLTGTASSNNKSKQFLDEGYPVISVDTRKKEVIGNYKNNGAEYRPNKDPVKVKDHAFWR